MTLTLEEHWFLIQRYNERFNEYGEDVRSLGWKTKESQLLRFKILSDIADLKGKSILDIGCGFGHMYDYLRSQDKEVTYSGIDLLETFLEVARRKHPEVNYIKGEFPEVEVYEQYDYVMASGLFNTKLSDNHSFIRDSIRRMYDLCRYGVAINMMSDKVDFMREDLHYYNPGEILEFCLKFTRNVTLRHDYPLYEFTVYIYKNPPVFK